VNLDQRRIDLANEKVSLVGMMRALGVTVDEPTEGSSMKVHCPFGAFHSDGGSVKSFRVYPTNTGYCFECAQFFNPVILEAKHLGFELDEQHLAMAATTLLSKAGIPYFDIESILSSGIQTPDPPPDHASLLAALLERNPGFDVTNVPSSFKPTWERLQQILPLVRTSADAARWLDVAHRKLDGHHGEAERDYAP
jgi:hypothetical protein